MKQLTLLLTITMLFGCAELQKVAGTVITAPTGLTDLQIGNGLKEALQNGISKQVSKLTSLDGFYGNAAVKILLPKELTKMSNKLNSVGLGGLTDKGVKLLNRAAEDAVKEATPIFVNAITTMSFADAKSIIMGHDSSATTYLNKKTYNSLYQKFYPQVEKSLTKVGADDAWATVTKKYNAIPFVSKVNPDLKDYVTKKALIGVFKMITVEEKQIRGNLNSRTSDLLKQVFALQDK
ncbi:MAG: hypothetical protein ACJA0Q_000757 [Saprospiraceae bacterium]|jgi:hypothetical protein